MLYLLKCITIALTVFSTHFASPPDLLILMSREHPSTSIPLKSKLQINHKLNPSAFYPIIFWLCTFIVICFFMSEVRIKIKEQATQTINELKK